ncbi:hypothetical protein M407DRAFT_242440 [Tulasnella calospora MUT 4182]|uniref:Uncharacterized protein n=1 Tax=Tulasnella calospora MUT 4182 TaxID=1051891 RepID=A0A0C3QP22_9AGAM|nr:hypothetical protein M407DRAFT_242440 [Tulasnella calospora MUT 4182]
MQGVTQKLQGSFRTKGVRLSKERRTPRLPVSDAGGYMSRLSDLNKAPQVCIRGYLERIAISGSDRYAVSAFFSA